MKLVETVVAAAIVAIAAAGLFFASAAAARFGTQQSDPRREAANAVAEQTLRTAANAWKYAAPGSPAPQLNGAWNAGRYAVTVSTSELTTPAPSDPTRESATVRVTVSYDSQSVNAQTILHVKAPLPGSTIDSGATVTPPPGAP